LEEAQDMAFQIERNLDFDDYIEQRNLNCELWDPGNEPMAEPEPPSILQIELAPAKRKWSLSHKSDISSQEPPLKKAHPKDEDRDASHKIGAKSSFKTSLFLFIKWETQFLKIVSSNPFMSPSESKIFSSTIVYCTQEAKTNIMTEEVMQQLGLKISQANTRDNFAKGIINNLEVAFDSCPSAPFLINVVVVDDINNFGIIICNDLIEHLNGSIHREQSRAIIPHPEGGFYTIYNEPFVGSPVENPDEIDDQLLCINSGLMIGSFKKESWIWTQLKKQKESGP
jgi:hypothetical protein